MKEEDLAFDKLHGDNKKLNWLELNIAYEWPRSDSPYSRAITAV